MGAPMIKLLHTADVHLDAPLRSLALRDPALREIVQTATRTAFIRIIDTAIAERATLLIAGDLFDGAERSAHTAAFLAGQFDRLSAAGLGAYLIRGNHDAENPLSGAMPLPDNVHIFDGRGGKAQLPGTEIWIHGVSFASRHAPDSLLPKFPAPVPGAVNIALLHTSLAGAPGHDPYAPCSLADLTAAGFEYWALGHIHTRRVYSHAPWVVMPGMPQGRDIGEAGPKSAILLTVTDGTITIDEVPTAAAEFVSHRFAPDPDADEASLRASLRTALRDVAGSLTAQAGIVRLTLAGETRLHWQILRDRDIWAAIATEAARDTGVLWLEKLVLDLRPPASDTATPTATDELGTLMQTIRQEPGHAAVLTAEVEALLTDLHLPQNRRAALMPDQKATEALAQSLAEAGAARLLARMKGATE